MHWMYKSLRGTGLVQLPTSPVGWETDSIWGKLDWRAVPAVHILLLGQPCLLGPFSFGLL